MTTTPTTAKMAKRVRETRRSANERLVDFITKLKGSDKCLLEIMTREGSSKWLVNFRSAKPDRVFTYLEEDDQIDEVFKHINLVLKGATKCELCPNDRVPESQLRVGCADA
ncbi:PWWP domain-containing DNA repair factor 3B-like [Lampris incognitus]|uniref:PWWP domain-containing DNA repair factor 3B-like n=1 Tax=Lampris incognitus TaxID=2546036 RepID=UPI0024B48D59|nr:PWWP domain-containing DNA repair factor 3B-like [Lampris incognitus]